MLDRVKGPSLAASVLVAGTLVLCPVAAGATETNAQSDVADGVVLEVGETETEADCDEPGVVLPSEPAVSDAVSAVPDPLAPTDYDVEVTPEGEKTPEGDVDITPEVEGSLVDESVVPEGDGLATDEAEPEAEASDGDALIDEDSEADQETVEEDETPKASDGDESSVVIETPEVSISEPSLDTDQTVVSDPSEADGSQPLQVDPLAQGTRGGAGSSADKNVPADDEDVDSESQVKAEADVEPQAEVETSEETKAERGSNEEDAETEGAEEKVETIELYRLYNPYTGEHLFSTSASERDTLVPLGWKYEGVAWVSPKTSDRAVYRLFNPYAPGGDHHYTTDKKEYDALCALGWRGEELAWYSADDDGTQLFRFYNPYVSSSTHHYTSDAAERLSLVALGWLYEGVAWFGVDTGPVAPSTSESGWVESEGARFYGNGDGTYATGWKTIDGTKYHFDKKGRLSTGVTDVDGTLHYFGEDGKIKTGWQKLSDFTYYFENDGTTKRCGWWDTEGKRLYLDTVSGAMAIGWKDIDGGRYYFESSGSLYRGGWLTLGGQPITSTPRAVSWPPASAPSMA